MTRICPCCKRPISTIPIDQLDILDAIPKPRQHQLMLDALVTAYPRYVSLSDMVLEIWQRDGREEPDSAENTTMVYMNKLRTALGATEWVIQNQRGVGYRLVRLEGL